MTSIQLALDFLDLERAVALARDVADLVERVEAGTPLIKRYGMQAVSALRTALPDHYLVADLKTMDAGAYEATMALDAGADLVTVLAAAGDNTIRAMAATAHERSAKIMADLMGVRALDAQLTRLAALGIDSVCLHLGADDQGGANGGRADAHDPFAGVDHVLARTRVGQAPAELAVAGGIDPAAVAAAGALPHVLIVGGAICNATDPRAVALAIRHAVETHGLARP